MTAELAGLEERRRGAEAAFQRIDRLHADLERRVHVDRPAADRGHGGARAAHRRERRRWPRRQKELAASRAEALALAQTIAAQSQALRQQLAEMETRLKTGRAALDQLREDRAAQSSELAKLHSDLEYLEASCLAEVNVEAQVLREDAEIVRLLDEELTAEEETCRALQAAHRADGPGEHDGSRRVQGDRRAARVPGDAAQGPGRVDREHAGDDQGDRPDYAHQVRRGLCQDQRELRAGLHAAVPRRAGVPARSPMRKTRPRAGSRSWPRLRARSCRMCCCSRAARRPSPLWRCWSASSSSSPAPSACSTKSMPPLDETNVGRLADLLHSLSKETQFLLVTHSKRMMQSADMIYGVTMQEPGVSKIISVKLGGRELQRASA